MKKQSSVILESGEAFTEAQVQYALHRRPRGSGWPWRRPSSLGASLWRPRAPEVAGWPSGSWTHTANDLHRFPSPYHCSFLTSPIKSRARIRFGLYLLSTLIIYLSPWSQSNVTQISCLRGDLTLLPLKEKCMLTISNLVLNKNISLRGQTFGVCICLFGNRAPFFSSLASLDALKGSFALLLGHMTLTLALPINTMLGPATLIHWSRAEPLKVSPGLGQHSWEKAALFPLRC